MITPKSTTLLKSEVEKRFGKKIVSSADCQNLCDDILLTSKVKISFNTVRRFFSLMRAANQPSRYTLNALCNYCGFSSFDNFIIAKREKVVVEDHKNDEILLSFLTLFFKEIEVGRANDQTYLNLVQQTILHLDHYPHIIDAFQMEIAKTKNGQDFYFERFVFVDKLNSYFGRGLQYYLEEKQSEEAQVFGYSVLCYQSWLLQNKEDVERYYKKVMEYDIVDSEKPFINARYFASQLFYAEVFGLEHESIISKAKDFYFSTTEQKENNLGCFELILSEALILTGKHEEALFYVEEVLERVKNNIPSHVDAAFYENLLLFKAIILAHTRKKAKANKIIQEINTHKFSFLAKKYMNILYLSTKQFIKNKKEEEEQIQRLIEETGFTRLLTIWLPSSALAA